MTYPFYTSETGRYALWYKTTCLKDNLTAAQAAEWLMYWKLREDNKVCEWPLEVAHMRIRQWDGVDRTSPRKK